MSNSNNPISFTVKGEPASKANSRQIVTIKGKPAVIKSKKARDYVKIFALQCRTPEFPLDCDVRVTMTIFYASRRPDLDESVILDCMQAKRYTRPDGAVEYYGGIYKNDRQVKEKHIYWALDKENPRAEIRVEPIDDCS